MIEEAGGHGGRVRVGSCDDLFSYPPTTRTWVAEVSQGSVWLSATEGRTSREMQTRICKPNASTGNLMYSFGFPTD